MHERLGDLYGECYRQMNDQDFQTVKVQLMALDLVNVQYTRTTGGYGVFLVIDDAGEGGANPTSDRKKSQHLTEAHALNAANWRAGRVPQLSGFGMEV